MSTEGLPGAEAPLPSQGPAPASSQWPRQALPAQPPVPPSPIPPAFFQSQSQSQGQSQGQAQGALSEVMPVGAPGEAAREGLPAPERYTVLHETRYAYTAPVSQSWQLARLTPRALPWQSVLSHALHIEPPPDERRDEPDSFGNTVTHFGLHGAHRLLRVRMECLVDILPRSPAPPWPAAMATAWEAVRDNVRREPQRVDHLMAARMSESTQLLPLSEGARLYAAPSFARQRGWFEAVHELMQRIYADFEFQPGATTVSTSVDEVLYQRSGVCQDFAHLMLACLRGLGLPARYVSGYLLTEPPPGQPRLMGVDASHAWVAAFAPEHGWVEFDPTNNQLADQRYITLAWGADFADVVPLRGVILGGGDQRMDVEVSVIPS